MVLQLKPTYFPLTNCNASRLEVGDWAGDIADAAVRARAVFLRHIQPWAQQALAEVAGNAQRHFYRGLAAMISAFLGTEFRRYAEA